VLKLEIYSTNSDIVEPQSPAPPPCPMEAPGIFLLLVSIKTRARSAASKSSKAISAQLVFYAALAPQPAMYHLPLIAGRMEIE